MMTILANQKHLSAIKTPAGKLERGILERILKTATALSLVTASHGVYTDAVKQT